MTRQLVRLVLVALALTAGAASADIPSPTVDACRDRAVGDPCEYRGERGDEAPTEGRCMATTCRTPGPYGREYACAYCGPASTQAVDLPATAQGAVEPASASASAGGSTRVWISIVLGAMALLAGLWLLTRSARRTRG